MNRQLELKEHQKIMLNILTSFASFCDSHNLVYFLDAGTLLGAIRHKGFIPWDNDVDVCMLRPDFDRFLHLLEKDNYYLNPNLKLLTPFETNNPAYKLCDINTTLIEFPKNNPNQLHAYIDIFPKDGIEKLDKKTHRMCNKIAKLGIKHWRSKLTFQNWKIEGDFFKRLFSALYFYIHRNPNHAIIKQHKIIQKYQKKHPFYRCNYVTTLLHGEFSNIISKDCFNQYVLVDFEGRTFKAPCGFKEWLRNLYGNDYMTPPPLEKRIVHDCKLLVGCGPKLSIVVTIYNKSKFIKRCLLSLVNQTYLNIEIICIDDCSSDGSLDILKSIALDNSKIKVVCNEKNLGVSKSRNKGIEIATGDYITFVDADDYVDEHAYEIVSRFFKYAKNEKTIFSINGKGRGNHLVTKNIMEKYFILGDVSVCSKIFDLSFIRNNNILFKDVYMEDALFCFDCMKRINRWFVISEHLYFVDVAGGSRSRSPFSMSKDIQGIEIIRNIVQDSRMLSKRISTKAEFHLIHSIFSSINKVAMYGFLDIQSEKFFAKKRKEYVKYIRKKTIKSIFTSYFTFNEKMQILFISLFGYSFFCKFKSRYIKKA